MEEAPLTDSLPVGWFFDGDIAFYRHIYRDLIPAGGKTVEVGVYRGRSLAAVADIIREKQIHVTAVDIFTPQLDGESGPDIYVAFNSLVDELALRGYINIIRGASTAAANQYPDGFFDFVFIDADHNYKAVKADIDAWAPKLRAGGLLGGHDYWDSDPGVVRAVDERIIDPEIGPDSSIWLVDASRVKPAVGPTMKLGIALPSYSAGGVGTIPLVNARDSKKIQQFALFEPAGSALTLGFNSAWCWALNGYREGHLTHFLMMHSDVRPVPHDWLDLLIEQMELADCDVLSAIIPIKDGRGLTSTALEGHDIWRPVRLTQTQVHKLPATWTCDKLLINTGLMLIKLSHLWTTKDGDARVYFKIRNAIMRDSAGVLTPRFEPEDWRFSRDIRTLGFSQYVTRAVNVQHHGNQAFPSDGIWGWETDQENSRGAIEDEIVVVDAEQNRVSFNPLLKDAA